MSHEISRMYASADHAREAVAELAEEGFDEVFVVSPPGGEVPVSAIAAQIAQGRVHLPDAKIYAEGVSRGGTLVTVHAPFASGRKATVILDSYNPIPSGKPEPEPEVLWNEATPFSSAMHMPLLLDDPAPASRYIGISPLAGSNCSFSGMIGLPLLSEGDAMPEGRWGLPFLSNNPAPLSSLLGLPLLKNSRNT
jgi:pimeloyl-ACP methyl ester carboxylesterase